MQNNEEKYIKREVFDEICEHLERPEITLITGSRQVGKTVLLGQLRNYLAQKKGVKEERIFYYNLDIMQDWEMFQKQSDFIEFLRDRSRRQKIYVFVDEAQRVSEAARFFKGVYDSNLNVKLILTGSSSLELKAKLKETLAGRKKIFQLLPFVFFEFLRCKDAFLAKSLKSGRKINKIDEAKIINFYKEYTVYGGYPRAVLSNSLQEKVGILKEIYSSYVEKDIVGFLEIKNKTAFNRLIKLLAGQIGQLVNIEELAVNLAVDRQTVERYIHALEETFIIKRISPYFTNARQEIIKAGKIYFADTGLRNLALENFAILDERIDKGAVLENAVFTEIAFNLKNTLNKLRFWRTRQGAEVDFVVAGDLGIVPIETKFTIKKESISLGMRNFIKKFKPKKSLMLSLSLDEKIITAENTKVYFVYPFKIKKILQL